MTDTKHVAGGAPVQATQMVSADQVTIVGNGTAEDPLRSAAQTSLFAANYVVTGGSTLSPVPGLPVVVDSTPPPPPFVASVTSGSAAEGGQADVVAVVVRLVEGGVVLRGAGPVTLTAVQWDVVTGSSGGLVPNAEYYLDLDGRLTTDPPLDPGTLQSRVGVAISAFVLLLTTPSDPFAN